MLKIDASKLIVQFKELEKQITNRLENMVKGFSYTIVIQATGKTPLGDADKWANLYEYRQKITGLRAEEGLARGGWYVDLDGVMNLQLIYGVDSDVKAMDAARNSLANYRIGDTVMVANSIPYIGKLEDNYSDQTGGAGIMRPTLDAIYRVTASRLNTFYKDTF